MSKTTYENASILHLQVNLKSSQSFWQMNIHVFSINFPVVKWLLDKDFVSDKFLNKSFTDWFLKWLNWFIKK